MINRFISSGRLGRAYTRSLSRSTLLLKGNDLNVNNAKAVSERETSKSNDDAKFDVDSLNPPIENGLYYGKFTKDQYESARKYVVENYTKLSSEIKGDKNIRENLHSMPSVPSIERSHAPIEINNLTDLLLQTIKTTGPISLSSFMRQCLTHPDFGYYTTRDPLDLATGDFITSPEISSMFGEMVGLWLYATWLSQGKPSKIRFIEFGPGKGTLAHDSLHTFNKFVNNSKKAVSIEINMIEASTILRQEQYKLLCDTSKSSFTTTSEGFNVSTTKWNNNIKWVDTEKDIESDDSANYILAHEFFDALPIKSFQKTENGWRELMVEHTASVNNNQPLLSGQKLEDFDGSLYTDFHLTLSPIETPASKIPTMSSRYRALADGTRIEICTEAELYLSKIIQLVNNNKTSGGALIVDYGLSNGIPENSLRGIYKHKFVSPFFRPGDVDLSIDVDFENLKLILKNHCQPFGPVEQGVWLHELGIGHRTEQLILATKDFNQQERIYQSYKRLTGTDDKGMGSIYKFLCLLPKGAKTPVGFGGSVE